MFFFFLFFILVFPVPGSLVESWNDWIIVFHLKKVKNHMIHSKNSFIVLKPQATKFQSISHSSMVIFFFRSLCVCILGSSYFKEHSFIKSTLYIIYTWITHLFPFVRLFINYLLFAVWPYVRVISHLNNENQSISCLNGIELFITNNFLFSSFACIFSPVIDIFWRITGHLTFSWKWFSFWNLDWYNT